MADSVGGRRQPKVNKVQPTPLAKGMRSTLASVYKSSEEITMEARKSGMTSLHKGSEECFEYNCDPCKDVGEYAEAQGFCTDCKEYLCSTCFRAHSRGKLSIHHVLLGPEDMPRKFPKVCNPCKTFGEEIQAVGYCEDCCDLLCENCYKSHPRNKLTRNHVLNKRIDEPLEVDNFNVTTTMAKMNIIEGTIADLKTNEKYTYVRDINVKLDTDERECYIGDMALVSNYELVLCDRTYRCLKLVDIEKNKIKEVLALQYLPNGITTLSNDQVAVVLSIVFQIQIVTARGKLTLERTIKTNGQCLDVKMMNKHLYVSFMEPVKFQILQMSGAIIKTIKPDNEVLVHCTLPRYIAISPDESVIFVSDWQKNKVFCLDMKGNMIALYQEELDHPEGIVISPSGSVYVCNRNQHIVYKMTSDLSEAAVIIGQEDGIVFPQAICFETKNKNIYVSSANAKYSNNLKVYKC